MFCRGTPSWWSLRGDPLAPASHDSNPVALPREGAGLLLLHGPRGIYLSLSVPPPPLSSPPGARNAGRRPWLWCVRGAPQGGGGPRAGRRELGSRPPRALLQCLPPAVPALLGKESTDALRLAPAVVLADSHAPEELRKLRHQAIALGWGPAHPQGRSRMPPAARRCASRRPRPLRCARPHPASGAESVPQSATGMIGSAGCGCRYDCGTESLGQPVEALPCIRARAHTHKRGTDVREAAVFGWETRRMQAATAVQRAGVAGRVGRGAGGR